MQRTKASILILVFALWLPMPLSADVIEVGPGLRHETPSAAARVAQHGDRVEIMAGDYQGDVAVWRQNNLTIRGMGSGAHLRAAGRSAEGKAIWVIKGDKNHIENITFSGTRVRSRNGAGIRIEGAGLVIENSTFMDNEMGILGGDNPDSDIVIQNSTFIANRVDRRRPLGHNIYLGNVRSLTVINSDISGAVRGHNVKSRARTNRLTGNRITDGPNGAAGYLVDLPAGGIAIIRDNVLEQGPRAENFTLLSFGAERLLHDEDRLEVMGNRFVNEASGGTFIRNHTDAAALVRDNRFKGSGTILRGTGHVSGSVFVP